MLNTLQSDVKGWHLYLTALLANYFYMSLMNIWWVNLRLQLPTQPSGYVGKARTIPPLNAMHQYNDATPAPDKFLQLSVQSSHLYFPYFLLHLIAAIQSAASLFLHQHPLS